MVATTSTELCSASDTSASEPIMMPTTNLATAIPALANTEIAATRVLLLWTWWFMGCGLAAPHRTRKRRAKALSQPMTRLVTNFSDFSPLKRHDDLPKMLVGFHVLEGLADIAE